MPADNSFIYSADDMGNAVWSHTYNSTTGKIERLQKINAPTGADPRHLAVHPNGVWVFVLYEKSNQLAVYRRDAATGMLHDTNTTFSLLPAGMNNQKVLPNAFRTFH